MATAEQVCSDYGPGRVRMGYTIKNGQRAFDIKKPWDTHWNKINRQQDQVRDKIREYDDAGCKKHLPKALKRQAAEKMTQPSFNPSPEEWLGPDHPICSNVKDSTKDKTSPELPTFPGPGRVTGAGKDGLLS